MQDQFSFLKQIGYLPEGVHPAQYLIAPSGLVAWSLLTWLNGR